MKHHVVDHLERQLRAEAVILDSLSFFKPNYLSLTKPHPLWTTTGSSPVRVAMAIVQAQMLSSRFRTEQLCSHWSKNKAGVFLLSEACSLEIEDNNCILSTCSALKETREKLMKFSLKYYRKSPQFEELILSLCNPDLPIFCQYLLDCSRLSTVIAAYNLHGNIVHEHLFEISRTWVYTLHKARLKKLGRWNPI